MDSIKGFTEFVCNTFDELKTLFLTKNEQYGDIDPLANFRTGALMEFGESEYASMYEEAKAYARKHIAHVQNNNIEGSKIEESLRDIAVYAVIMLYMHQKHFEDSENE